MIVWQGPDLIGLIILGIIFVLGIVFILGLLLASGAKTLKNKFSRKEKR